MSKKKFKSWWVLLFRGIIIGYLGIKILLQTMSDLGNPDDALINLSVYFGSILFLIGTINIVGALNQGGERDDWNWLLSEGMLDLVVGSIIMIYPFMTGPILLLLIGIWALAGSIIQITNALINKEHLKNWKITIANGIILLILVYLYLNSSVEESATMVFYLFGTTMCIFGLMYIIMSFSIKGMTPRKVREFRGDVMRKASDLKGITKSK